jgi:hypothetical protein
MFRTFVSQYYVKSSAMGYGLCVCSLYPVSTGIVKYKTKGTVNTTASREGTEGELRYNFIALLFLQPRR